MADLIKQYRTRTTPEEREKAKGAGAEQQSNNYTTSSRGILNASPSDIASSMPKLMDVSLFRVGSKILHTLGGFYQTGLKITLSEIGFFRQLFMYGARAKTPGIKTRYLPDYDGFKRDIYKYNASTPVAYDRQDQTKEWVFRCGDYFLPLSFTYSVKAGKRASISQLVDGVEIIQQINKKPKIVDVQIRVERNMNRIEKTTSGSNMAFLDANSYSAFNDNAEYAADDPWKDNGSVDPATMAVMELGSAFTDLYETQDVFEVQNKTLNNDLGLHWVFMEDYEFITNPGSTIVDIHMTLHEINMDENAIVFGDSTVNSSSSAGGGGK